MSFEIIAMKEDDGRPTYFYDLDVLSNVCARFVGMDIPHKRLFFATMANDHPAILRGVAGHGIGAFVNSLRHLGHALEAGIEPRDIVYASTSMGRDELERCFNLDVHVVVDSLGQLTESLDVAPRGVSLGVRVAVGSALDGQRFRDDVDYRFGMTREELAEASRIARSRGGRVSGVHAYFGTNILDPNILLEGLRRLGRCVLDHPDLEYVDVGGGFGTATRSEDVAFDFDAYVAGANEALAELAAARGAPVELRIEPGRSLVAECGAFMVRVRDVKVRPDRTFVGTNASVAQFPRPLLHPETAHHAVRLVGPRARAEAHDRPIHLTGSSTYSRDFLARDLEMPLPEPGDRLLLLEAGAYGRSMLTRFLGKTSPREVVFQGGHVVDVG